MENWVGPAIVAAFISGLVSLIVVQLNFRQGRRIEQLRRNEKVRDFQIALRAEIESDILNMEVADRSEFLARITAAYSLDPTYSVIVPRLATNVIFDALVHEIHVLPEIVITPVVDYARLRQIIERFVDDLRTESFRNLSAERQLLMYSDYLSMSGRLEALAAIARASLDRSLTVSSPVADRSSRGQASGPDGASDSLP